MTQPISIHVNHTENKRLLPAWRDPWSLVRFGMVAITGLVVDLWTKHWALNTLGPESNGPIDVIKGYFRFSLVHNPGAVFGFAAGARVLLITVSLAALIFMGFLLIKTQARHRLCQVALGMLSGGALGNIHDRIFNDGLVTDFIEIDLGFWPAHPWPNFNIADSLLCVGVALLMWHLFRLDSESNQKTGQSNSLENQELSDSDQPVV